MLRRILPNSINSRLFGDRFKYGLNPNPADPEWEEWQNFYNRFYNETQKQGSGSVVNNSGYRILRQINFDGMNVLEIGPGSLPHIGFWFGLPSRYTLVDVDKSFLESSLTILEQHGVNADPILIDRGTLPDVPDGSLDFIVSFYSLEHILDLEKSLRFYHKKLKAGGQLVGAIPNEGGLAWGLGRYLTSRRFVHKNSNINYDKIICWEHPNFIDEIFAKIYREGFVSRYQRQWPFGFIPLSDMNLVTSFIFEKP